MQCPYAALCRQGGKSALQVARDFSLFDGFAESCYNRGIVRSYLPLFRMCVSKCPFSPPNSGSILSVAQLWGIKVRFDRKSFPCMWSV